MPFVYIKRQKGTSTDPCGTPYFTICVDDIVHFGVLEFLFYPNKVNNRFQVMLRKLVSVSK